MIARTLAETIARKTTGFPIISILGACQTGKTTLAQAVFPNYAYVNLENPDERSFAESDPRGFLTQYPARVIIDEVQRVPVLFSYLQTWVDKTKQEKQFILTGSHHFLLLEQIPQSLAGRMAIFTLNPLSSQELIRAGYQLKLDEILITGFYPALHTTKPERMIWFNAYLQTYLDRDIRQIANIVNLSLFERFLRLLAARTGTLLNLSTLGRDLGISHNTVKAWIQLLKISGVIHLVYPYFKNLGKRLIKSPKLYFSDVGLASWLMGIQEVGQVQTHPLRGALFETLVINEVKKYLDNHGLPWKMYFYRDQGGLEVDLVLEAGLKQLLVEIKASYTAQLADQDNLLEVSRLLGFSQAHRAVLYAGDQAHTTQEAKFLNWQRAFDAPDSPLIQTINSEYH